MVRSGSKLWSACSGSHYIQISKLRCASLRIPSIAAAALASWATS